MQKLIFNLHENVTTTLHYRLLQYPVWTEASSVISASEVGTAVC